MEFTRGGKASLVKYHHTCHCSPPRGWTEKQGMRAYPQGHQVWPYQNLECLWNKHLRDIACLYSIVIAWLLLEWKRLMNTIGR